jgi:uncharacterized protein YlxW (UPF0749 family)
LQDSRARFPPLQLASLLVVVLLLGFLFAVQIRSQATAARYLSGQDNVSLGLLITGLSQSNQRLSDARSEVQQEVQRLNAEAAGGANPATPLQQQLTQLEVVEGTLAVHGPGLVITVSFSLHDYEVEDLANALRQSGAEAIDISGHRITARSVVGESSGRATIDGQVVAGAYRVSAVGDPAKLAAGADTIAASLKTRGSVTVDQPGEVRIASTIPEHPVIYSSFGS